MSNASEVAKALEACDWSGVPIGNKAIIAQAIELLGAQQAEPVAADPAVAAIQFALETHSDGLHFLRLWNEGEFDLLRREWPEAPQEIYIGADPLLEVSDQPPAVPDGYALVPVDPTREMFKAVDKLDDEMFAGGCAHGANFEQLWEVAILAAPKP